MGNDPLVTLTDDNFEAEVIRARRAQGAFGMPDHIRRLLVTSAGGLAGIAVLSFVFLMM